MEDLCFLPLNSVGFVKIDTLKAVLFLVALMKYFSYFLSSLSDL